MEKIRRQKAIIKTLRENKKLYNICKLLKQLRINWKNDKEIEKQIHDMWLPFKFHMYILWKYSDIMALDYK